jgi:hypothetical protein
MSDRKKIAVNLKGPEKNRAPFAEFSTVCSSLHSCLKNIARCLKKSASGFGISQLKIGSAIMEIEPEAGQDGGYEVMGVFTETIASLESGDDLDSRIDSTALHCFQGFSSVAKSKSVNLRIGSVLLTANFANNLAALIDPSSTSLGSVSGRLEAFDLHNKSSFTLYPPIAGEEIDCVFDPGDLPKVLDAVKQQVTVYGTLHYSKSKIYPVRVDVESFEVNDSDEALPNLLDARGLLPPLITDNPIANPSFADEWY